MSASSTDPTIRRLRTLDEYDEAVAIQDEIWGRSFRERVPGTILMVSQKIGGVAAGAFAPDGRLLGFVFGMTGLRGGRLVHWSDMLAVRAEARGQHLGERLKRFQLDCVREIGVDAILWTFDPLVARNAHFNIQRLGAHVIEYVPDMYGSRTDSTLHRGLPTDRLIVEWPVIDAPRDAAVDPAWSSALAIDVRQPVAAAVVRIEVPHDFHGDDAMSGGRTAADWRAVTRAAFQHAFAHGYRVIGFLRASGSALPSYVLSSRSSHRSEPA